jgi:predicted transcriptional regulator of viral defense system
MLRNQIQREEFDHQILTDALRSYARPRDKISDLLRKGIIVRVKKGLYIFGKDYRRQYASRELLANLIYGPSYVSLDFALQHYGMIPERVEAVTSVTTGRSRRFSTPIGLFTYRQIPVVV